MIELNDINLRLATRQDAIPITKLLHKVGLIMPEDEDIGSHWDRLDKNNPSYKDFPAEEPHLGWLMEYHKQIVGYLGCFPRTYYFNQKPMQVCVSSQWGVEKEFRRFTILLCEKFFNETPFTLNLTTTAKEAGGLINEKYGGGKKVPVPTLKDVYMIPLHIYPIIEYRVKKTLEKYKFLNPILKLFSLLIPVNIKFKFTKPDKNFQEVDTKDLPKSFEVFWENYLKNCNGFIASRSAEVVKWYYGGGFRKLDKKVFAYYREEQITGYASLMEEPIFGTTIKRYKIADILTNTVDIQSKMLKALIKKAYDLNADIVEVHLPGMVNRNEIPAFTLKRTVPYWPCYYKTPDIALDKKLQNPANWHISPYDGDSCLF